MKQETIVVDIIFVHDVNKILCKKTSFKYIFAGSFVIICGGFCCNLWGVLLGNCCNL